jgi:hypothetical protein
MNEADLDTLLFRASRRLRAQRAIRTGLLVLAFGILISSATILWARFNPQHGWLVGASLLAPPTCALAAMLMAFLRYHPQQHDVAMQLDQRAKSEEHLLTWVDLRDRKSQLEPLQRGFQDAQRAATLRAASEFQLSRLMPLSLPDWSRSMLLAVLLLCCALLVPARNPAARKAFVEKDDLPGMALSAGGGGAEKGRGPSGKPPKPPIVVNLSKEDLGKLRLIAFSNAPKEVKTQSLKDLKTKLGDAPRSQLPPEIRDLLAELEADTGTEEKPEDKTPGSAQRAGTSPAETDPAAKAGADAVAVAEFPEKAFSLVRDQFKDVRAQLENYYK